MRNVWKVSEKNPKTLFFVGCGCAVCSILNQIIIAFNEAICQPEGILLRYQIPGRIAQLVRALHSHCKGRWFESSCDHIDFVEKSMATFYANVRRRKKTIPTIETTAQKGTAFLAYFLGRIS